MPKYMLLFVGNEERWESQSKAELEAMYKRIGGWWQEHSAAGRLIGGEELAPARTATTVRFGDRGATVMDGPFMEAKEMIGGYALIDVPDLDAAIAVAKGWPTGSTVEIRPIVEMREMS